MSDGKLCEKDLNNLRNWNLKLDKSKASKLITAGIIDQIQSARRLKSAFSSLFKSTSKELYEVSKVPGLIKFVQ